jgi:SagB-type dehydrogenase family enzyme
MKKLPEGQKRSRVEKVSARERVDKGSSKGWPPLADAFHRGTKDVPWATRDGAEIADTFDAHQRTRQAPPASPFKASPGRGIALPKIRLTGEFPDVLLRRRTWRGFGRRPITRAQVATLLQLTFGATLHGQAEDGAHVLFKTSPSAGALHPTEAYLLAVNVTGIRKGLYHFSPRTSRLHLVRGGATADQLVEYLSGQWWYGDAAALVLMTSVVSRVWTRYPHARAYRSVLLDAGHLCQTFCLVATWMKLAPFCTQALADSRIERDLGIDGVGEVLIYAAGVGSKPRDGKWVQWPEHEPGHPYVPPPRRGTRR